MGVVDLFTIKCYLKESIFMNSLKMIKNYFIPINIKLKNSLNKNLIGKVGFPKFKSKKNQSNLNYTTVNISNSIRLNESNKHIKIPKLNFVRIKLHRQLPIGSTIKHITISKTATNKYYVS